MRRSFLVLLFAAGDVGVRQANEVSSTEMIR